jgi:hypothetical protein
VLGLKVGSDNGILLQIGAEGQMGVCVHNGALVRVGDCAELDFVG